MSLLEPDAKCSECAAPIVWAKTVGAKGATKAFPVDPKPDPVKGNVTVTGGVAVVLRAAQADGARAAGQPLYVSHFVTCPYADRFRRKAAARSS